MNQASALSPQENTQRFIKRAAELGYTVIRIKPGDPYYPMWLRPTDSYSYTPEVVFDQWKDEWQIQTTAYGALIPTEIKKVSDAYLNAIEMVAELNKITADNVVAYLIANQENTAE